MAERLPEIREEDASPDIAALYGDIRRATGTPQVNLIFRHLALEPSVLDWCWRTIAPVYRDGRVAAAVSRLHAGIAMPRHPPVWETVDEGDAAAIRAVLAYYDRGNSSNLLGLTTLLRVARNATGSSGAAAAPAQLPTRPAAEAIPAAAVPPLPRQDAVPPDLMALVTELAERQGTAAFGVLPSLWLHLTLWPEVMRQAHAAVVPILDTPEWRDSLEALMASAGALADELAGGLDIPSPAPPDEVLRGYLRTVGRFVGTAIPQMVLVGRLLSGGGPAQPN